MSDDKLLDDLGKHITNLTDFEAWIDKVYYDSEFGNMFNRPVLSILSQAIGFLRDNMFDLERKYRSKMKGK